MKIKVLAKQTFYDISIQYFGTADYAFAIALENQKTIWSTLSINEELTLPDLKKETKTIQYYTARNIIPATAYKNVATAQIMRYTFPQGEFPISF